MSFALRDAIAADRPHILRMMAALTDFERGFADDRGPGAESADAYWSEVEQEIAEAGGGIIVAEAEGGLIGLIGFIVREDDPIVAARFRRYGYVCDLFVEERWRRRGVGFALFRAAEERMRGAGLVRIAIGALAGNAAAIRAYEKWGFRRNAVELVKDD